MAFLVELGVLWAEPDYDYDYDDNDYDDDYDDNNRAKEEDKLHVGELGVLCPEPDVAVSLSHMVPPERNFHKHL